MDGESELVDRSDVLLPDRQSAELAAAARRNVPSALDTLPLEYVDETLRFPPGVGGGQDRARAPSSSSPPTTTVWSRPRNRWPCTRMAGEPKRLVVLEGYGHYEVYTDPAFTEVMDETVAWFREHLPPR